MSDHEQIRATVADYIEGWYSGDVARMDRCLHEDLVKRTAAHVGISSVFPRNAILCFDEYVGPGYSLPTPQMAEAVKMLARLEGILMDPVYTGKAMAGLIDLVRKGYFNKDENILFIHTGGSPALNVYVKDILD